MSKSIDVLAVMDREVERAGGESYSDGRDLIEARAAVAELIEALTGLVAAYEALGGAVGHDGSWHSHALSAIAKATGDAA